MLEQSIEFVFHFGVVWSLLATVDYDGRLKLDRWYRAEMTTNKCKVMFPQEGTIYDYQYSFDKKAFVSWSEQYAQFEVDVKLAYHEIVIPTNDSTRNIYLMKLLLSANNHVLCPGATGTGKS